MFLKQELKAQLDARYTYFHVGNQLFFLLLRIEPRALTWTKTITDVYFVNVLSAWER